MHRGYHFSGGFGIVVLVKFIQPGVMGLINHLNDWLALGIVVVMTADLIWTVVDTVKFQQAATAFEKIRSCRARKNYANQCEQKLLI